MLITKRPYRVLMIDDSQADMRLMDEAIKMAELNKIAETHNSFSVDEGFAELEASYSRGEEYNTILLDLNMPRKGGLEMLRMVKEDERFAGIPVFIVTNSDQSTDIEACKELGADSYFQKPSDFSRLVDFFMAVGYSLEKNKTVSVPIVESHYEGLKAA